MTGFDAGPATICWHLREHHDVTLSESTIWRILVRAGLIAPEPKKKPKSSYIRFQADLPNETWQSDFTHYRLTNDRDTEIITWLDDHSRLALHVSAYRRVLGPTVVDTFLKTIDNYGIPASTLTDNGMVYTTRFSGGKGGRNGFEALLRDLNIIQKNSKPNHPTTCGKVERFQQTMKKWLTAQPEQPSTLGELQQLIDTFVHHYNHDRPHRSLAQRSTPAAAYAARPKADRSTNRDDDHHQRVRHDIVTTDGKLTLRMKGRLHHIGIGREHATTPVLMLIHDLEVTVIDKNTGEIIRELTIDTSRDYQPTGKTRYPRRNQKK